MPRYKLTLEYAGTRYSGWQIQKNARTVQGELERALASSLRSKHLETYGAGRTDAGVHALGQVVHVDTAAALPPATLVTRVNDALPSDINVLSAERVPPRFHARHSAVARSYVYQIAIRRTAFAKPFVWWVREDLDLEAIRAASEAFVGFSDFRAFTDDDRMHELHRDVLGVGAVGAAAEGQQPAAALKALGHQPADLGQAFGLAGEERLAHLVPGPEAVFDAASHAGDGFNHLAPQQIRGSGSPTSMSTMRLPP